MLTSEIIKEYLDKTVAAIKDDADSKRQKLPEQGFRVVVNEEGGQLWGADYFKYLVLGRGPGKFPPPDKMLDYVEKNPSVLADAKRIWKNITAKGLAYIIGRSIAEHGTQIFQGKKPGLDFLGAMEANMPSLLQTLARNEAVNILTNLRSELK